MAHGFAHDQSGAGSVGSSFVRLEDIFNILLRFPQGGNRAAATCSRGGLAYSDMGPRGSFSYGRRNRRSRTRYATTSTPMLRAVPLSVFMAASTVKQFRSGILILAISSTCFSVITPTLVLCGSGDPLARFTARLISTGTGGVLVIKVNERSEKIVITTGMISPSWSLLDVLALNALQKSMMLTPCGPRAVPTGGAGVAFPAGICNFTEPVTFFAI